MIPHILEAKHVKDYVIHLRFSDGTEGDVDLRDELDGEIFQPLRALSYFVSFSLHPELRTLTWPNGADFAPEFLLKRVQIRTS